MPPSSSAESDDRSALRQIGHSARPFAEKHAAYRRFGLRNQQAAVKACLDRTDPTLDARLEALVGVSLDALASRDGRPQDPRILQGRPDAGTWRRDQDRPFDLHPPIPPPV